MSMFTVCIVSVSVCFLLVPLSLVPSMWFSCLFLWCVGSFLLCVVVCRCVYLPYVCVCTYGVSLCVCVYAWPCQCMCLSLWLKLFLDSMYCGAVPFSVGLVVVSFVTLSAPCEKYQSLLCWRRSMVAALKLEGIDGTAPVGVELAAQFASTRENSPGLDTVRIDRLFGLS